jgi:hypothetical protein
MILPWAVPPASHLPVLLKDMLETVLSIGPVREVAKASHMQSERTESARAAQIVPRGVSVVISISI